MTLSFAIGIIVYFLRIKPEDTFDDIVTVERETVEQNKDWIFSLTDKESALFNEILTISHQVVQISNCCSQNEDLFRTILKIKTILDYTLNQFAHAHSMTRLKSHSEIEAKIVDYLTTVKQITTDALKQIQQ